MRLWVSNTNEHRRHWIAGLSPANIITLLAITMAGAVAWGVDTTRTTENVKKIEKLEKTTTQDIKQMEQRITTEISESEQRTNARIERMEKRLSVGMNEIKQAIVNIR